MKEDKAVIEFHERNKVLEAEYTEFNITSPPKDVYFLETAITRQIKKVYNRTPDWIRLRFSGDRVFIEVAE